MYLRIVLSQLLEDSARDKGEKTEAELALIEPKFEITVDEKADKKRNQREANHGDNADLVQ